MKWGSVVLVVWILGYAPVGSALDLELTQGVDGRLPIAVVPFEDAGRVTRVVQADLAHSGRFSVLPVPSGIKQPHRPQAVEIDTWRDQGADYVVVGALHKQSQHRYQVHFFLVDLYGAHRVLVDRTATVSEQGLRCLSHHISDVVYQHLLQVSGVFSTRIAYIRVDYPKKQHQPPEYRLQVADADGFHPQTLLISHQPIMSPAWLPNGKGIAYVSFEGHRAAIYVQNIATGQRRKLVAYPGINGAPAWSPDGRKLAIVLSKGGSPNLYLLSLATGALRPLTQGAAIDTEPHWTPDGRALVFTSDRGGSPQIYRMDLATGAVQRLTFEGHYNAGSSLSADGRTLALLHRVDHRFTIAVLDRATGDLRVLTESGVNDAPSIAPNGSMVLFATRYKQRSALAMVSTDGRVRLYLPVRSGDVQDPVWSGALRCRGV